MTDYDEGRPWRRVYASLRVLGPDTFVPWESFEGMTGNAKEVTRSCLSRARAELEAKDGLTIGGQCAGGFYVWKHEK